MTTQRIPLFAVTWLLALSTLQCGAPEDNPTSVSGDGDGDGDNSAAAGGTAATTGGTGGTTATTGGTAATTGGADTGTGGTGTGGQDIGLPSGGSSASAGGSGSGGSPGLDLIGDPPASAQFPATYEHWDVLPSTDEFATYYGEAPFAIAPLSDSSFPPGYDYCNAVGMDPELNMQQLFARAQLKAQANLKTWYYDVTLISVPEEDGNTPYQLLLDGEIVREYTAPDVGTDGALDNEPFPHVWEAVPIEAGQVIEIRTRANTNLELEEADPCRTYAPKYAWARGRFSGLNFAAAATPPTN